MIAQSTIEKVLDLPLEQVLRKYMELEKKGASFWGCCPFHEEKTPSFNINPAKNIYKCFGCGEGGSNVVKFVMRKTGLNFPDAIEDIANGNNILIEKEDSEQAIERAVEAEKAVNLVAVNEFVRDLYVDQLADNKREFRWNRPTMKEWEMGFAPDEWRFVTDASKSGKVALAGLKELGLTKESKGKTFDAFRDRLMFPIYDHRRRLVGFSGRYLGTDAKAPKYINSPESVLYNKSKLLFGLHTALPAIREVEFAVVVEGAADVISAHAAGLKNTVAPCGTALTVDQLKLLSRSCKALVLMYDGDAAGRKAMEKNAVIAIEQGFTVDIFILSEGDDPDNFFRMYLKEFCAETDLYSIIRDSADDFIFYSARKMPEDLKGRAKALEEICRLLAYNDQDMERAAIIDELVQLTGSKSRQLTKTVNTHRQKLEHSKPENLFWGSSQIDMSYTMPDGVTQRWDEVKKEVLKYGYFTDRNRIYMRRGSDGDYTFRKVSNFSIRVIQHMEDEKFPRRLVQIINVSGRKRTFDTSTDDFVTELAFKKMLEGRGNYTWEGRDMDFMRLTAKLKDDMGDGRMISILGWQPEQFWVFNNAVIVDGDVRYLDEHGCFELDDESYYVPSGNSIYERNVSKYFPQKRARYIKSAYSFSEVSAQIKRVHSNHAINTLLFAVATSFRDVIFERTGFFPLFMLYGEAGSGKDALIEALQSLNGKPQTPITITGKGNTIKAKIRKFAQFMNMLGHMTEYAAGNLDIDNSLKSMFDGVGYERGTIESAVGTESIQIIMGIIFTGNDYPVNDALITRFIGEEMNTTEFTEEQKVEYEKLKDMTITGYSHLMQEILKCRKVFLEEFRTTFKAVGKEIAPELSHLNINDRMIQNAAVLGATYKLTHERLNYPFTWEEFKANMLQVYERQSNKRSTGSVVAKWWESFIASIKDRNEPIREHREFSISGNELAIRYSSVYGRYLTQHSRIFRENGLSKTVLLDKLKKSDAFDKVKDSHRYGDSRSSAICFNLSKTGVKEQLLDAMLYVEQEEAIRSGRSGGSAVVSDPDERTESANGQMKVVAANGEDDLPW